MEVVNCIDVTKAFATGRDEQYGVDVLAIDFTSKDLQAILKNAGNEKGTGTPHFVIEPDGEVYQLVELEDRAKFVLTQEGHEVVCPSLSENVIVRNRESLSFNHYSVAVTYSEVEQSLTAEQFQATPSLIKYLDEQGYIFEYVMTAGQVVPKYFKAKKLDYLKDLGLEEAPVVAKLESMLKDIYDEVGTLGMQGESDGAGVDEEIEDTSEEGESTEENDFDFDADERDFGFELNSDDDGGEGFEGNYEQDGVLEDNDGEEGADVESEKNGEDELEYKEDVQRSVLEGMSFKGGTMSYAHLSDCILEGVTLTDCEIEGGEFEGCILDKCSVESAEINNSTAEGSKIKFSTLINSKLNDCEIQEIEMTGGEVKESRGYGLMATNVTVDGGDFRNTEVNQSILIGVHLEEGTLTDTVSQGPVTLVSIEVLSAEVREGFGKVLDVLKNQPPDSIVAKEIKNLETTEDGEDAKDTESPKVETKKPTRKPKEGPPKKEVTAKPELKAKKETKQGEKVEKEPKVVVNTPETQEKPKRTRFPKPKSTKN